MSEHAERNRAVWTVTNREYTDPDAHRSWACPEITWGVFELPERELGALGDVRGLDVIELGCGTAYFSSWLARLGARPVGVDITPAQLETARRCQQQFGLTFPLIEADAEHVPLPDASFDLALSEYGASLWCDPKAWLPEAARLLRPGGRLVFLTTSLLAALCLPSDETSYAGTQLLHAQRELRRVQWTETGGVEFHPSHGDWLASLRASGFEVERLEELYAPAGAQDHPFYKLARADWAQRWPVEELWVARKR
ncbi:MAG TPA: methyltransferase domain-containing protein [Polyangiales bacterium]|nr:methyltransferase domain-containing protein [Polyangiales bacterium]